MSRILCWLVLYHGDDKSSAVRFRIPGQLGIAIRAYRASRKLHDDSHLGVEWQKLSTDYYLPCEDCLKEIKHIHRASDLPVARTFGGKNGLELDHKPYIWDETILMSEYGSLHTLAEIRKNIEKVK